MLWGIVTFHKWGMFCGIRYIICIIGIIPLVAVCVVVMELVGAVAMVTGGFLLCAVT